MTPEQMEQVRVYAQLVPSLKQEDRGRHRRKITMFLEQDGLCCICEKPMNIKYKGSSGSYATHEHVICKSNGGTGDRLNTPLSHGTCNNMRGTQDFHTFKSLMMRGMAKRESEALTKQKLHAMAQRGDDMAIEHFLASSLGQELYAEMSLEGISELKVPKTVAQDIIRKCHRPLNFGLSEFIVDN